MKEWMLAGLALVMGGCVDLHTKTCTPQRTKTVYTKTEFCHHLIEYTTETPLQDEGMRR